MRGGYSYDVLYPRPETQGMRKIKEKVEQIYSSDSCGHEPDEFLRDKFDLSEFNPTDINIIRSHLYRKCYPEEKNQKKPEESKKSNKYWWQKIRG